MASHSHILTLEDGHWPPSSVGRVFLPYIEYEMVQTTEVF